MDPAIVAGRVIDVDGHPVGGASVLFTAGPVALPDIAQVTGDDGRFALVAPARGRYRVGVHAAGYAAGEGEVEVATSAAPLEIVLGRTPC